MARTLYFSDGSKEILLREDDEEFAEILEARLGKDVAEWFGELIQDAIDRTDTDPTAFQDGYEEGYADAKQEFDN